MHVSTEALAAGVNTDADYVIVLETTSIRIEGSETEMSVTTCEQMVGRAGRAGHCGNEIQQGTTTFTGKETVELYFEGMKAAPALISGINLQDAMLREMAICHL